MGQDQSSSKIQGVFFKSFSRTFFERFKEYGGLISCFDKNFNERQSYGLVVTSLMDIGKHIEDKGKVVDFVLTEVGMIRNGGVEGKKSGGRVDYLIGFGGWLFLIELKLKFVKLGKSVKPGKSDSVSKSCAVAWDESDDGVVRQLRAIKKEQNPALDKIIEERRYEKNRKIFRFPLLIVMYASDNKKDSLSNEEIAGKKEKLPEKHSAIAGGLNCAFNQFYPLANTITRYHTRRTSLTPCYRTTYGVGIMAGAEEFQ